MFRAIAASLAKSASLTGWREEICKSDPNNDFACVSIPFCTLALSEWIATSAAIPETMASEKITNRSRWVRLSRQAIRQVHRWNRAVTKLRGRERESGVMENSVA